MAALEKRPDLDRELPLARPTTPQTRPSGLTADLGYPFLTATARANGTVRPKYTFELVNGLYFIVKEALRQLCHGQNPLQTNGYKYLGISKVFVKYIIAKILANPRTFRFE